MERRSHCIEQRFYVERFGKECRRTAGQSLRTNGIKAVGREEDGWNEPTVRTQAPLQLQAVHAGHPQVENQACN
jgi:hypothetical protein